MSITQHSLLNRILQHLKIENEIDDHHVIHQSIVKDSIFKGTNLWILVFAIIVASVGLNMNSTAVIIGAMLISPLMGPINAMGYSIATYNFDLFRQAGKNFVFAVLLSLLASTIYFSLSPLSTAHSELLARTSPTIYDVLIALFGGLAGIVAISSKLKGNVIPGVAIATALMPPLCTAGYGLATAQFAFFFGAMYLFAINTVFMALASASVSQILKFPIITLIDKAQKKKVNRYISIVIALVLLPSVYFGYGLVQKEKFNENASNYVLNVSIYEGNFLLKHDINHEARTISLVYAGANLTTEQRESIIQKTANFGLQDVKVDIKQGFSFDNSEANSESILREEISKLSMELMEKQLYIDSLQIKTDLGKELLQEIRSLFPEIVACTYADSYEYMEEVERPVKRGIVLFKLDKPENSSIDTEKVHRWVNTRLKNNNIKVIFE